MLRGNGGVPSLSATPALLLISLFSWVWYSLAGAAIIVAASQAYLEGHVDIGAAFRQVFGRVGAVLYSSLYKGLAIGVGVILLLVGAIYYYATYFAVPTTVVIEGLTGANGVKRSRELASGNRWRVLGPTALVFCIYLLIIGAITLLGRMVFGANATTLQGILSIIMRILIYPIVPITELLVYYDLRIRVEGYDVEVMASKLDASVAPPAA
jgi:hypothetical protein